MTTMSMISQLLPPLFLWPFSRRSWVSWFPQFFFHHFFRKRTFGWRHGLAVARWFRSMKLLYTGHG